MHVNLKLGLAFVVGLVVGGIATKKYTDYKFEQEYTVVEEELHSEPEEVIAEETLEESQFVEENIGKPLRINSVEDEEYVRLLDELRYIKEEEDAKDDLEELLEGTTDIPKPDIKIEPPYNISQADFEDIEAFESDELTYYADEYVTDSYGNPMSEEDVIRCIGPNFRDYFGTYMDDQIWVRNTELQMDYSVLKDLDRFVDVAPMKVRKEMGWID